MQITGRRIFSAVMLLGCAVTVYQIFSKPQPIAVAQSQDAVKANASSFDQKIEQLETPRSSNDAPVQLRFTSDEVSAEIAQSTISPAAATTDPAKSVRTSPTSADTALGQGQVQVKGYEVKLDGDVARGQFTAQIAGKDVYVTLAGHLGSQDGYVTFDPTEFKVGELNIPVSLVNSALQKKLVEQREQLKLPPGIASLRVQDSQLVITQK